MKVWHIQTWGAGTPHYLVSGETKKEAWLKVKMEWKKKYGNYDVGGYRSVTNGYYIYQTENNLKEIVGLTTQTSLIVDLNEKINYGTTQAISLDGV